jgi:hypothetical protein
MKLFASFLLPARRSVQIPAHIATQTTAFYCLEYYFAQTFFISLSSLVPGAVLREFTLVDEEDKTNGRSRCGGRRKNLYMRYRRTMD